MAEERLNERLKALLTAGKVEPVIRELSPYAAVHDAVAKCVGYFATTGTSAHFAAKLGRMGIPAAADDVVTSGEASADAVRSGAFLVGSAPSSVSPTSC